MLNGVVAGAVDTFRRNVTDCAFVFEAVALLTGQAREVKAKGDRVLPYRSSVWFTISDLRAIEVALTLACGGIDDALRRYRVRVFDQLTWSLFTC